MRRSNGLGAQETGSLGVLLPNAMFVEIESNRTVADRGERRNHMRRREKWKKKNVRTDQAR